MTRAAGMRALLDVNVLVALHDPQHIHHGLALDWLEANAEEGWASCPITQNGCLRVMSQPAYANPLAVAEVARALGASAAGALHAFWPDDVSLLDGKRLRSDRVVGHRQLTDLYLLALAVQHKGRFVTFDARIPLSAVVAAQPRHLVSLLS